MNIIKLISELGGFIGIIYSLFAIIPIYYNAYVSNQKFIKKLYFIDKGQTQETKRSLKLANKERFDPVSMVKKFFSKEEKNRYDTEGNKRIQKDLNLFNLIQ